MIVEATGLRKTFASRKAPVEALRGIDLSVDEGEIVGLLGPNGAGKTTTIHVLTTLLRPDAGQVRIAGIDVLADPAAVRPLIGLTGQFAALDEQLTARENLVLFGRLFKLGTARAKERATQLLDQFDLADAADRRTVTFSGGMRRRLDLAASMIGDPKVLFLDEPTTGLDPRSRNTLWEIVQRLRDDGMTIILTTQYLAEADELGLTLPLSAAVAQLWDDTATTLGPDADFTAVIQPIERAAGVTVESAPVTPPPQR